MDPTVLKTWRCLDHVLRHLQRHFGASKDILDGIVNVLRHLQRHYGASQDILDGIVNVLRHLHVFGSVGGAAHGRLSPSNASKDMEMSLNVFKCLTKTCGRLPNTPWRTLTMSHDIFKDISAPSQRHLGGS